MFRGANMDSYIVRIYRRTGEPPECAGHVENVGTGMKVIFHNSSELVKICMSDGEFCGIHGAGGENALEKDVWGCGGNHVDIKEE